MGNSPLVGGNIPTHYIDNDGQLQPLPPPDNIRDILDPVSLQVGQAFDDNTDVSDNMIAVQDGRRVVRYYSFDTIGELLQLQDRRWCGHPETRTPFTEAQIVTLNIIVRRFQGDADSRIAQLLRQAQSLSQLTEEIQNLIREWGGVNVAAANRAAENGHMGVLQQLYEWDIVPTAMGANLAAENGYLEVLHLLHDWGINANRDAANSAAQQGNLELLIILHNWGINVRDFGANLAAKNGHMGVLQQLYDWDIVPTTMGANLAAINGHREVLHLLHDWGINASHMAANEAADQGNLEVLTTLHNWGINTDFMAANRAAATLDLELLTTLHNWGINATEEAANTAAAYGHAEILQILHDWGINVGGLGYYNPDVVDAARRGHIEVLRKLFDWGYLDYDVASIAAENGQLELAEQLRQWTAAKRRRLK